MNIGDAIEKAKCGHRIARPAWNGKGMWVQYHGGYTGGAGTAPRDPYLEMMTAQGTIQAGWLASQPDLLATDWVALPLED